MNPSNRRAVTENCSGTRSVRRPFELINENVHVESVRDDIETLVMDAQVIEDFLKSNDPAKRGKEIEITLIARLRKHFGNPKFTELGERLEKIKERHEQGLLTSVEFLKQMLELAQDILKAEKQTDPVEERDRAKEALTELFKEAKTKNTHIIVERIVADIDDIVKKVRFDGWKHTTRASARCSKSSAARCSNTNCTPTRTCSTKLTAISGSIIEQGSRDSQLSTINHDSRPAKHSG